MKRRKAFQRLIFVLLAFQIHSVSVFADGFLPEDPVIVELRMYCLQAGVVFPITAFPAYSNEVLKTLGLLRAMGGTGTVLLERLTESVLKRSMNALTWDFSIAYDARVGTSDILVEENGPRNGIDIQRLYLQKEPIALMELGFATPLGLSGVFGTTLRREWNNDFFKADNLPVFGIPDNPFAVDNHFMSKGLLLWETAGIRLSIGRDKLQMGAAGLSTLYPSTRIPYLDQVRLSGPIGPLTIDMAVATLQPAHSYDSFDVDPNAGVTDGSSPFGFETDVNPSTIFMAIHRFQWNGTFLRFALGEEIIYVRRNNAFYLTDFLPLVDWHSTDMIPNNVAIIAEASWTVVPGFSLTAMAGFDDISSESFGVADSGVPTVDAYILAAEWAGTFGEAVFKSAVEAGYTHYLWGNFDGYATAGWDPNPLSRFLYRYQMDGGAILLPLSSPYGPGAIWVRTDMMLAVEHTGFIFRLNALLLFKNSEANLIDTPYQNDAAVAALPLTGFFALSVPVEGTFEPFFFRISPSLLIREDKVACEVEFLAEIHLGGATPGR